MRKYRIISGVVLLLLAAITFFSRKGEWKFTPVMYFLNTFTLFALGVYYLLFNKKKDVIIDQNLLVIKKGNKKLKELDLTTTNRIVHGYKSMKIIFRDFTETLHFSDFNEAAVQKLRSLQMNG